MLNILYRQRIKIAFAVGKMIHRIKDIGFSNAIFTHEAIDFGIQFEGHFREIFVIE